MDGPAHHPHCGNTRLRTQQEIDTLTGVEEYIVAEVTRLHNYALSLLQDSVAADDLVQDCLERGISRIHLFQSGTNLRA